MLSGVQTLQRLVAFLLQMTGGRKAGCIARDETEVQQAASSSLQEDFPSLQVPWRMASPKSSLPVIVLLGREWNAV